MIDIPDREDFKELIISENAYCVAHDPTPDDGTHMTESKFTSSTGGDYFWDCGNS